MKKFILMALLATFGSVAHTMAQGNIVRSKSRLVVVQERERGPRTFMWTARLGGSLDSHNSSDLGSDLGFYGGFGFTHYVGGTTSEGLFWGIEAQGISNNAVVKPASDKSNFNFGIVGQPRIGYKFPVGGKMAIAPYVGGFVGVMLEGDREEWDGRPYNSGSSYTSYTNMKYKAGEEVAYGATFGIDFFLTKSFFLNLELKKSFAEDAYIKESYPYDNKETFSLTKLNFGIGFQF